MGSVLSRSWRFENHRLLHGAGKQHPVRPRGRKICEAILVGVALYQLLEVPPHLQGSRRQPAVVAPESPADLLFKQGRDLRYAQRWFEAAQAYRTLLRDFPTSPRAADARYWLASILEQNQRWDEAAEAYTDFLIKHPDQRLLGKEARLNRVRCWGIRQWDSPTAQAGLANALTDDREEVRIAAALQLARHKDPRAIPALQAGIQVGGSSEACRLALQSMGVQPQVTGPAQGRFLVVRVKERGKEEALTVRATRDALAKLDANPERLLQ